MKKQLVVLGLGVVLMSGYVMAQEPEVPAEVANEAVESEMMEAVEVGNKTCPITGEELNLSDANAYTTIEVDGAKINVSAKGKEAYDANPSEYADKIAAVIAEAEGVMEDEGEEAGVAKEEAMEAVENAEQK